MVLCDGVPEGQDCDGQARLQPPDDRPHLLVVQHARCMVEVCSGPDAGHVIDGSNAMVAELADINRHDAWMVTVSAIGSSYSIF